MQLLRRATQKGLNLRKIKAAVPISERPSEIADRAASRHRKGDLILSANNCDIATLVERQRRFVMLAKVGNKDTNSVIPAFMKWVRKPGAPTKAPTGFSATNSRSVSTDSSTAMQGTAHNS